MKTNYLYSICYKPRKILGLFFWFCYWKKIVDWCILYRRMKGGETSMENHKVMEAVAELKHNDIRITPQRYAILEYLIESHAHPTADEIYQALVDRFPNMSVATVYNNLRLFTKIGFVQEMAYGDASSRFDFASKPHYHAICEECGKIVDTYYPGLEDVEVATEQLTGFKIHEHRMELYGVCPECQAKKSQLM